MKIRKIKFGYNCINGVINVNNEEKEIVSQIFTDYISGKSLLKIAEKLNDDKVVYFQGQTGWNKARIKRIIEDETYTGSEQYTAIIDKITFQTANKVKNNKNTQENVDRDDDIYNLRVPIICGRCGSEMKRSYQRKLKCGTKWICKNPACNHNEQLSDEKMLEAIMQIFNNIISGDKVITYENTESIISKKSTQLENEVNRELCRNEIDKVKLNKKIFEIASLKYQDIGNDKYITEKLKADFGKQSLLSAFSLELFYKTVSTITLRDEMVIVTLKNGQKVGNVNEYNSNT